METLNALKKKISIIFVSTFLGNYSGPINVLIMMTNEMYSAENRALLHDYIKCN